MVVGDFWVLSSIQSILNQLGKQDLILALNAAKWTENMIF